MADIVFDAYSLKYAFLSAATALDQKKDWINELNVFPVPDGDTGTNMTLTIMSAAADVANLQTVNMENVCKAMSSGSLRGARGNSGVILSQLIRGFTKELKEHETADTAVLTAAFTKAVDTAYKAVMKPKEGTILTVARGMSTAAEALPGDADLDAFLTAILKAGDETLARTPELLPVLKQAGVVDSGGQGLMVILHAAADSLRGKVLEFKGMTGESKSGGTVKIDPDRLETSDIKFGYCTEFIIKSGISPVQEADFKDFLMSIGDSVVCVADDDLVKVHVHTNDPGKALSYAVKFGELTRLKIDNMREEHNEIYSKEETKAPRKPYGIISVSVGEGLSGIFRSLGCDHIIEGGQTMNPSAADIADAVEAVNADTVYVLPNNKNIILAANQAAQIMEDVQVIVVPSKTIPQGISAMINFNAEAGPEENLQEMERAISEVRSCEVTYAVRNTCIDGFEIHENDIMAIGDQGMLAVDRDISTAVMAAMEKMVDGETDIVTVFYGADCTEADALELANAIQDKYPDIDVDVQFGGQPVYYYLISVE